jgi:hypothetical protein
MASVDHDGATCAARLHTQASVLPYMIHCAAVYDFDIFAPYTPSSIHALTEQDTTASTAWRNTTTSLSTAMATGSMTKSGLLSRTTREAREHALRIIGELKADDSFVSYRGDMIVMRDGREVFRIPFLPTS